MTFENIYASACNHFVMALINERLIDRQSERFSASCLQILSTSNFIWKVFTSVILIKPLKIDSKVESPNLGILF